MNKTLSDLKIRCIFKADLEKLIQITATRGFSVTENQFLKLLRLHGGDGLAAEYDGVVVGFVTFIKMNRYVEVTSFCVSKDMERQKIGKALFDELKSLLDKNNKRTFIRLLAHGSSRFGSLWFLKEMGYRPKRVLHDFFDTEDAYEMVFDPGENYVPSKYPEPKRFS